MKIKIKKVIYSLLVIVVVLVLANVIIPMMCSKSHTDSSTINGTIIADERGPQLRTIENELYKKLKEEAENEEKKIKTAQKKDTVRNGSYSQK